MDDIKFEKISPIDPISCIGDIYSLSDFLEMVIDTNIMKSDGIIGCVVVDDFETNIVIADWMYYKTMMPDRVDMKLYQLLFIQQAGHDVKIEWCNK